MTLVLTLQEIHQSQAPTVGGKCLALADMARQGMNVPEALCVTTRAYKEHLVLTGLGDRIRLELSRKSFEDMRWEEIWDASLRVRNMFLNTPLPEQLLSDLKTPITKAFNGKATVVRSSAPGEDSAGASFAGLHESYVNVEGVKAIIDHIRLVWASLWSDRALLYRQELDLQVEKSEMAVIVQEIVVGDRSGVVFGKNPNDPSQAVIESVYGLNQGLVDGTVAPDRWLIDRDTGRIMSHTEPARNEAVFPSQGGVSLGLLSEEMRQKAPLNEKEIEAVFDLCMKNEKLFGAPQDVEWTFSNGRLHVLQSRPVVSALSKGDDDQRLWYVSLKKSFDTLKKLRSKIEEELIPQMVKEAEELAHQDLSRLSDEKLAEEILGRRRVYKHWEGVYWDEFIPMAHGIRLFGQIYNNKVEPADPYEFMILLGATDMVSLKRNAMLQQMAAMIRSNAALAGHIKKGEISGADETFDRTLDAFVEAFGDLSCGTDQCVHGRHAIGKILLELAGRDQTRQPKPPADFQVLRRQYLSCFEEDQRAYADELLNLGRASYRLRDDDNIYLGKIRNEMNRAVSEGTARIEKRHGPIHPVPEVDEIVGALKDEHSVPKGRVAPVSDEGGPAVRVRQVVGQPAGPGIGKGRARVVSNADDLMDFRAEEVLVCDALDPTMTFVVPLCEGIVERRGGMLIHGAIIAREYGLPCVTGVPEASTAITTGDLLTVDGYLGIVTIHREDKGDVS